MGRGLSITEQVLAETQGDDLTRGADYATKVYSAKLIGMVRAAINWTQDDESELEAEIAKQKGLRIVEFAGSTCAPCRTARGILQNLSREHPEIILYCVEVDKLTKIKDAYNIQSVPRIDFHLGDKDDDNRPKPYASIVGLQPAEMKAKVAQGLELLSKSAA